MISVSKLADLYVEVADTLVADFDLVDFLDHFADEVVEVSGAKAVGVVLVDHSDRIRFMAGSTQDARAIELLQIQNDEGPCRDCVRTGLPVVNNDLAGEPDRWPGFTTKALEAGYASVHAFPMRLRSEVIGAMNLFGDQTAELDPSDVRVVQSLADVATIAILQERNTTRAEALTEQLQGALNSRIVIEQAKGALAQSDHISTRAAFELMRSEARRTRRRLVEVAQGVLDELEPSARG